MALTIIDSVQNQSASANSIALSGLTGIATGDLVICSIHGNTQASLSDGNGSTPFTAALSNFKPNTSSGHVMSIFYRILEVGDPTTYTFNSDATNRISGIAVAFRGFHADIWDVAPSTTNTDNLDSPPGSGNATAPAITTLTANALHCALAFIDASIDDFDVWPSGYTVHESVDNNQGQTFTTKVIAAAGDTGIQTFEHNGSGTAFIGLSFSIKDDGISSVVSRGFMTTNTEFWGG